MEFINFETPVLSIEQIRTFPDLGYGHQLLLIEARQIANLSDAYFPFNNVNNQISLVSWLHGCTFTVVGIMALFMFVFGCLAYTRCISYGKFVIIQYTSRWLLHAILAVLGIIYISVLLTYNSGAVSTMIFHYGNLMLYCHFIVGVAISLIGLSGLLLFFSVSSVFMYNVCLIASYKCIFLVIVLLTLDQNGSHSTMQYVGSVFILLQPLWYYFWLITIKTIPYENYTETSKSQKQPLLTSQSNKVTTTVNTDIKLTINLLGKNGYDEPAQFISQNNAKAADILHSLHKLQSNLFITPINMISIIIASILMGVASLHQVSDIRYNLVNEDHENNQWLIFFILACLGSLFIVQIIICIYNAVKQRNVKNKTLASTKQGRR